MKAFPSPHDPKTGTMQLGMELRDYFAAHALQSIGIPANHTSAGNWTINESSNFAKIAYQIADEMMKARDA